MLNRSAYYKQHAFDSKLGSKSKSKHPRYILSSLHSSSSNWKQRLEPFPIHPVAVSTPSFRQVCSRRFQISSGGCPGVLEPRSLTYPTSACERSSLCQRHAPLSTLPLSFLFPLPPPFSPLLSPPSCVPRTFFRPIFSLRPDAAFQTERPGVLSSSEFFHAHPVAYPRKCSNYSRNSRNFAMDDEECPRWSGGKCLFWWSIFVCIMRYRNCRFSLIVSSRSGYDEDPR